MPSTDPKHRHLVAQYAAQRRHNPDSEQASAARRALIASQLAKAVQEQQRLASLLVAS
jgi:hypothetical protein